MYLNESLEAIKVFKVTASRYTPTSTINNIKPYYGLKFPIEIVD